MPAYETVRDFLTEYARENGLTPANLIAVRGHEHFSQLPDRYRRLVESVWLDLPNDWDNHVGHFEVLAGAITASVEDEHLAGARLESDDDETGQRWTIMLVTTRLDECSEAEVRATIAHEFAHVASGLPTDPRFRNDALCEDRANAIMAWWGFEAPRPPGQEQRRESR